MKNILSTFWLVLTTTSFGQVCYWQQEVDYEMDIHFDVKTHRFTGEQTLVYTNNSPDELTEAYWHLYFNAFQPGSMMDTRSLIISDPDKRVSDRISKLSPEEFGYHKIDALTQDGKELEFKIEDTVLEVKLAKSIKPGESTTFKMSFNSQVPIQIRRSGRNSKEGVDYSMSQWFPKLAEYDEMGWHAHPYVGREFYAPWGNYKVNITIDKDYILGGTGIVTNGNEIGYGYEDEDVAVQQNEKNNIKTLTWKFRAENVHDFMWAADDEYTHEKISMEDGLVLHFIYLKNQYKNGKLVKKDGKPIPRIETKNWSKLPEMTVKAFNFIEANYGEYPFPQYSIIQGGDGGMEYPMGTLITGERTLKSLVGVTVHEVLHSWYQGVLATNESYFAWMDEGFTSWASAETMSILFDDNDDQRSHDRIYVGYAQGVKSEGFEQPLSTHADHFTTNGAYGWGSYTKGAVILSQLQYIIGKTSFNKALLRYFNEWKFKHPDLNDFIRIFEKESGLELHWYFEYMVNTTHYPDYAIKDVVSFKDSSSIILQRKGQVPMPVDITVTKKDGSKIEYYIPLGLMRGEKITSAKIRKDWYWTHPTYDLKIDIPLDNIEKIEIDESGLMADVNRDDNIWRN